MALALGACARGAPASGDGGDVVRGALTTTTTTTVTRPSVRAALSCKTSRFPWARTPSAARAEEPHDHDHGKTELVLPLVLGRSRCPSRGHILVRVTTPVGSGAHEVEVEGLGQRLRASVVAGPEQVLAAELPLASVGVGVHPLVVRVDGRAVTVPAVDVTP